MQLQKKVKIALDETRILILGSQVLLGFQMQAAFRDAFDSLPRHAQIADGAALMLMVVSVACLIAPGLYHRIVESGNDSLDIHRFISTITRVGAALRPDAGLRRRHRGRGERRHIGGAGRGGRLHRAGVDRLVWD